MTYMLIGIIGAGLLLGANLAMFFAARYATASLFGVPSAWLPFRRPPGSGTTSPWARLFVTIAGPIGNYLLAAAFVFGATLINGETTYDTTVSIVPSRPAE